jgi:hypothetical protein
MDEFFDDFGKGEGLFTTDDEHARIRDLLVEALAAQKSGDGDKAAPLPGLRDRLALLLTELCAGRYADLDAATAAHPLDPYLRAMRDPAALEAMRAEAASAAAAAAANADKAEAAGGKGAWEPPEEDEDPETAQDME